MKRGFFGIGIYQTKTEANIGTLWRSAHNFGADFIFTIGKRYRKQPTDTTLALRHVPLYEYDTFEELKKYKPIDSSLVAIEQSELSQNIKDFIHPEQAIYILGAEDHGLPIEYQEKCHSVISINTSMCLNVAVAGSIVMFDRVNKT